MSEILKSVTDYIATPKLSYAISEEQWHTNAVNRITANGEPSLLSDVTGRAAVDLFQQIPFNDLQTLLELASTDKKAFRELRQMRRVLTLARDTLNICNTVDLIDVPSSEPLRAFIMDVGVVGDTGGKDPDVIATAQNRLSEAQEVAHGLDDDYLQPVDISTLTNRLISALATETLLNRDQLVMDPEDYHLARQSFRSVVYTGLLIDVVSPDEKRHTTVLEGLRLNGIHGDVRYKQQASTSESTIA